MVTVGVKSVTRLRKEFICNVRDMAIYFVRTNAKRFKFGRKANRFKVFVNVKSIERKLYLVSRFKCRLEEVNL